MSSTIRAEHAFPPATIAVPITVEISPRNPIQAPTKVFSAESMLLASCYTTITRIRSNENASSLSTISGVCRNQSEGIRSERSPNQTRVNPIICGVPIAKDVKAADIPISVMSRRFRSPRMGTPRIPRLS